MNAVVALLAAALMYVIIYAILSIGLNLQYGVTGVVNFTYYSFVAIGAFIAGVTSLGHPPAGSGETYILAWTLPFPIPIVAAAIAAGFFGGLLALTAFRRLRSDYLAITTLCAGTVAFDIVNNTTGLFNGPNGIYGVATPLASRLNVPPQNDFLIMIPIGLVLLAAVWWLAHCIDLSPYGRSLRAVRESRDAAEAFGKDTFRLQLKVMVLGCVIAGIGGALTVEFVGAFNPSAFETVETFVVFSAVILGGPGNNLGVVLGAVLVQGVIIQGSLYLPAFANQELVPAIRNSVIGLMVILVLYFRPQGLVPETRPRLGLVSRRAKRGGPSGATEADGGEG
ncbi:MAG: branched-chain amino acid ABC transporter permease [Candidatus Dormibacteria bacterium]